MINEKEKQGKSSDEGGEKIGAGKKSETETRIETKKAVKQIHNVAPIIGSVTMKEKGVTFKDAVDDVSSDKCLDVA